MTDYQFHSSDCPVWHPEKFDASGSVTSRCWCQRWSNLVDWNLPSGGLSPVGSDDEKKKLFDDKLSFRPTTSLQTDAFLGSNLWSNEELKDPGVDLDLLWKKLDEVQDPRPGPAANNDLKPAAAAPTFPTTSTSSPYLSPVIPRSPLDAETLIDLPDADMDLSNKSPMELEALLFDEPEEPEEEVKKPKRRGRPPGRTNKEPKRPRKRAPSFCDSISSDSYDPTSFVITPDDLKPVPIVKKSKKKLTPDDAKDDKYWARRKKNNMAAKRSRDIRRIKENQIAIRAAFLESEFAKMKAEVEELRVENENLRRKLEVFEMSGLKI